MCFVISGSVAVMTAFVDCVAIFVWPTEFMIGSVTVLEGNTEMPLNVLDLSIEFSGIVGVLSITVFEGSINIDDLLFAVMLIKFDVTVRFKDWLISNEIEGSICVAVVTPVSFVDAECAANVDADDTGLVSEIGDDAFGDNVFDKTNELSGLVKLAVVIDE